MVEIASKQRRYMSHRFTLLLFVTFCVLVSTGISVAQDIISPTEPSSLLINRSGVDDLFLLWSRVSKDAMGNDESRVRFRIYRDEASDFIADRIGGSNRLIESPVNLHTDRGAAALRNEDHLFFYLVSAVDESGNEGNTRPSDVLLPPILDGTADADSIDLSWSGAAPEAAIVSYKVYYGIAAGTYTVTQSVATPTTDLSLTCLEPGDYFFSVTALDAEGNESVFSNEIVLPAGGTVRVSILDDAAITPSAHTTLATVDLPPPSNWTRVIAKLTVESRLNVPCDCLGRGNCGGDEWDRTISAFMENPDPTGPRIEIIHAITPFGTDTRTGPRVYELDVTPLAPLLTGTQEFGVNITTWSGTGWFVFLELEFTEDPCLASPKPPADGIIPLFYQGGVSAGNQPNVLPVSVDIPATATQVFTRLFVSGHGGGDSPPCPNPADEFCQRWNNLQVDTQEVWGTIVWNSCDDDCTPWNACGFPSCTYPRSGWCPGQITCHSDPPCDQDLELTADLPAGGTYDMVYRIQDIGAGGSWFYSLILYWYE